MKSLSEYLAYYDPMRESNERYLPEDQATLRYSRVSVIADGKVIGASGIFRNTVYATALPGLSIRKEAESQD